MYKKPDFTPNRSEMLEILTKNLKPFLRTETIALTAASGRVCAENLYAAYNLPNKPVSSCDGIAVRFADFAAGIPNTYVWAEGKDYCFSNTGVAINEAFDTVIAIENVIFDKDGHIQFQLCPAKLGEFVGVRGGQIQQGELLARKGERVTPALMGILFAAGIMNIKVLAKPKVVFIPTGDELVPAGFELPTGKNVESNSLMLKAYLEEWGAEALIYPIIPDVLSRLQEAIRSAAQIADLILICAGSSKGSKDFTIDLLESLGKVIVYELGHGPGKHCSLAYFENIPIIGMPGPPLGADLTAMLYVKNTLRLMLMQPIQLPYTLEATLTEDMRVYDIDFMEYIRVFKKDGKYYARPIAMFGKTRATLYHLHNARFYQKKRTVYKAGQVITVEMCFAQEYIGEE